MDKKNISDLLDERKSFFNNHIDEMVAAYNREQELSKEYNGRQILELIQNADDARAKQMDIVFDKVNKNLIIKNDGEPFSLVGLKSILIANLSSKVTTSYIGNKGLGFRSIVVWAKEISIETGTYRFTFSREITKSFLGKEDEVEALLAKVREDRHLSKECIPVPMLGIPVVEDIDCIPKGCVISIKYKENFERDIEKQLDTINDKTLLFLPNIERIFIGDKLVEDAGDWEIANMYSADLPDEFQDPNKREKKKYQIQLAVPKQYDENAPKSHRLYNYLPTAETIGLPYIVHATLDLDSSRNHINQAPVNAYILQRAADLISEYVDGQLETPAAYDWRYYMMMTPSCDSSNMISENLYKNLREKRNSKAIFPVVGGVFTTSDRYYYYDGFSSEFWLQFPYAKGAFEYLLLPIKERFSAVDGIDKRTIGDETSLYDSLTEISNSISDINSRAQLIYYLAKSTEIKLDRFANILVDNECRFIANGTSLFTPSDKSEIYNLPDNIKIKFLNKELYDSLLRLLNDDIAADEHSDETPARKLCRILKGRRIADISDFDNTHIVRVIVSQTNKHLTTLSDAEKVSVVKEMVQCLYSIYTQQKSDVSLEGVRLIDQYGKECPAEELLLPTEVNRLVFADSVNYLCDESCWDVDFGDNYESFMRKLGVNRLIKRIEINDLYEYGRWLLNQKVISEDKPYNWDCLWRAMHGEAMESINPSFAHALNTRSTDQIIYLICRDPYLKDIVKQEVTLYFKQNTLIPKITSYSYLKYKFLNLDGVKNKILPPDVILDEANELCRFLSDDEKKDAIDCLTTNIFGMDDADVVNAINWLKEHNAPQPLSRKLYKSIIDSAAKRDRRLAPDSMWLYATDEATGDSAYYNAREVYYTANTSLPKEIIRQKNKKRFSYPSRQASTTICNLFGLEQLSELRPQVCDGSVREHSQKLSFSNFIDEIKPFVLMHYLKNTDSDKAKKDMANRIKGLSIVLVDDAMYTLGQSAHYHLGDGEFIQMNSIYYLRVKSDVSINDIQESVEYCDAISEIFAIQTAVLGQADIVIRIFQNPSFMKKSAEREFSLSEREQAFRFLGMSSEEMELWKSLLEDQNLDFSDKDGIYQRVRQTLGLPLDFRFENVDYSKWLTPGSKELLQYLNNYDEALLENVNLEYLHSAKIENLKNDMYKCFVHSLWYSCKDDVEKQALYIAALQKYSAFELPLDCHVSYSDAEYDEFFKSALQQSFGFALLDGRDAHYCLYPEYAQFINECTTDEQSLFYFQGNEDRIREIVSRLQTQEDGLKSDTGLDDDVVEKAQLHSLGLDQLKKAFRNQTSSSRTRDRKGGVHTSRSDLQKRNAGRKAELLVKSLLEKEGYDYIWVSGYSEDQPNKDDTLGYDFKYKKKGHEDWRFLEVKAFSGSEFIISNNELETSKVSNAYDVALVYNGNVYIVENFFKSENNYTKYIKDYYISCKILDK